jgi:hypothetical protein
VAGVSGAAEVAGASGAAEVVEVSGVLGLAARKVQMAPVAETTSPSLEAPQAARTQVEAAAVMADWLSP